MDRIVAVGRIFDAEIAGEAAAGEKILGVAAASAVVEARRQGAETAAVDADAAALLQRIAALGLDVDDAGGAQAELRRQRAGDQRQAAGEIGIEHMTEAGNAVRQNDAVDAVLYVGVLVAHVDVAIDGTVLRNARRLQQHGVDRRVGALRQRLDEGAVHIEAAGAEARRQVVARHVEFRIRGGEVVFRLRRWRCRRARRRRPLRLDDDFWKHFLRPRQAGKHA